MKNEILDMILTADISVTDWHHGILAKCKHQFAKGYLTRFVDLWDDSFHTEHFRENFLKVASYDIWT